MTDHAARLPAAQAYGPSNRKRRGVRTPALRPGSRCPDCGRGKLEYDGCLVLRCTACRYGEAGAPT